MSGSRVPLHAAPIPALPEHRRAETALLMPPPFRPSLPGSAPGYRARTGA
ncbi:hypothetical protein DVS28_b0141 (plasmid) [Euzebya pacifica]|uniref:Uncharacterized protein n=1 Tax=Euzebya pacifica TaxID=1608957 RepID=A0A346Y614_9ACTN|nr:hypothetical protein DVS28_b0141 [Euzebya pacifica]